MNCIWIGLLVLSSAAWAEPTPKPPVVLGKLPATRYTSVSIDSAKPGRPTFHVAKDVTGRNAVREAWRDSVNECGGVKSTCHVLKSWGKYGCLVIYTGMSAAGNWWTGHALAMLDPTSGNGAMKFHLEAADEAASDICDFHAHYDQKGKIYDAELKFNKGYCQPTRVICSKPLIRGEFE